VQSWTSPADNGALFPLWLDYLGPNGQSAIFGYCQIETETSYSQDICAGASAFGSWAGEGMLSFNEPASPQMLPPPPPYEDNAEGEPSTRLEAAATDGTLILGQDYYYTVEAQFVYQPGVGYTSFPTVGGKTCQYLDASGGGVDEGQSINTTNGISANGRYVLCTVEEEPHYSSTYMMDLTTGQATIVSAHSYEPVLPEWVSENGTEAIVDAEPGGGGYEEHMKWVSPVTPLP
jgi:hypothetical protein